MTFSLALYGDLLMVCGLSPGGIEPPTYRLESECSTTELYGRSPWLGRIQSLAISSFAARGVRVAMAKVLTMVLDPGEGVDSAWRTHLDGVWV
ncbi:hypothetical protein PC116_g10525 [Phytophthora cactorum]|uniref:Uncharacterized protein n=1 Tax=Phytophthora cactorum TaxID=29920 RepID=A0A8T1BA39_9STRA|nr:hypothetical protein PC117_g22213 [Phytophthora cactorum]KAG2906274.1 hypothetical protein PC114_g11210 [Phytophthora cactorum]KAG2980439.1 hypothetical protein PC119_g21267 [Phytophthora cactorum]KAG3179121.1 hypothetical protein C6341_g7651 [Phytophthora cactorum]KAG4241537.1 hypothetical protein PC116_g10525 [Phytophthora cactorum]